MFFSLGLLLWFVFYRKGKRRALAEHRKLLKAAHGANGSRRNSSDSTSAGNHVDSTAASVAGRSSSPEVATAAALPNASSTITSSTAVLGGKRVVSDKKVGIVSAQARLVEVSAEKRATEVRMAALQPEGTSGYYVGQVTSAK